MFLFAHTGITLGAVWLAGHVDAGAVKAVPLAVLGSNLPDLIDKPIGIMAPELGLGTGRGIAHTLAFNAGLLALGLGFPALGRAGLLCVAAASIGHLALDSMWRLPRVLWWPLMGFAFPRRRKKSLRYQLSAWWHTFWTDPGVLAAEVAGAVFLLAYVLQAYR